MNDEFKKNSEEYNVNSNKINDFYTPQELAKRLNVSQKSITNWTQAHRIPGQLKVGRIWRYDRMMIEKRLLTGRLLLDR